MGFNVETFFEDLEFVLDSSGKNWWKVMKIIELVKEQRKYAKECGAI